MTFLGLARFEEIRGFVECVDDFFFHSHTNACTAVDGDRVLVLAEGSFTPEYLNDVQVRIVSCL